MTTKQNMKTTIFVGHETKGGYINGPSSDARFGFISSIVQHPDGSLLVDDMENNAIRRIDVEGFVTTKICTNTSPMKEMSGSISLQNNVSVVSRPTNMAIGLNGEIYIISYPLRQSIDKYVLATKTSIDMCWFIGDDMIRGISIHSDGELIVTTLNGVYKMGIGAMTLYDEQMAERDRNTQTLVTTKKTEFVRFSTAIIDNGGALWIVNDSIYKIIDGVCVATYYGINVAKYGIRALTCGPDGTIYYVGASKECATEKSTLPLFLSICAIYPDGTNRQLFAHKPYIPCSGILFYKNALYIPHRTCILKLDLCI